VCGGSGGPGSAVGLDVGAGGALGVVVGALLGSLCSFAASWLPASRSALVPRVVPPHAKAPAPTSTRAQEYLIIKASYPSSSVTASAREAATHSCDQGSHDRPVPRGASFTCDASSPGASPATNPDGKTGINLHIIDGGPIASRDQIADIVGPSFGDWTQVDTIKGKYFPARWAKYAHYMLVGYQYDGTSSSGISRGIPAHDFLVTLGLWFPTYGTQLQQAGTLLHELGHNLGLQHGGDDSQNYKPNYLSVMSYRYQVDGLFRDGKDGVVDYSRLQLAPVDESRLLEATGMLPTGSTTTADTARYGAKFCSGLVKGSVKGPLDFNADGAFATRAVAVDLDCDSFVGGTFGATWNDWVNLTYAGSEFGGGIIGPGSASASSRRPAAPQIVAPDKMEKELDHP